MEKRKKGIVADWRFEKESILSGNINEENLIIKDIVDNNHLKMVRNGFEKADKYISWEDKKIKFENGIKHGAYFKTVEEANINKLRFLDGYTIEVILEISDEYNPWMGIITREGSGKGIGKIEGEPEILTTLSYNEAFQWTGYPTNLDYNPTNWSINASGKSVRKGAHHICIVNDGHKTTMYLNGVTDIRNPKEEIVGIEKVDGKGWLIGAALWDEKISSLFKGTIYRIRIANVALDKSEWIQKEFNPTIMLKGSNEEKNMLNKEGNYNFAIIPDSQYMGQANPQMLTEITTWLAENKGKLNLEMVMHVGDISEEASEEEFKNANEYFNILDENKCNYITTPGNHDYKDNAINYRKYFGEERFKNKKGFNKDSFNELNMYSKIIIGSYEYLFISLDYKDISNGVEWAKKIIKENKNKPTIIITHDCYDERNNKMCRTQNGEFLWKNLIFEENSIFMVVAGHEFAVAHGISKNKFNEDVVELLVNYQDYPSGGNGWIRLLEINEDKYIKAKTFSPWVNKLKIRSSYDLKYLTSEKDEFTINFSIKNRFESK